MFPRISVDKWGLNYKLRFTATIPTNFAAVNGGQLDSPTFNVNLLLFQKNITVAEIDVHDGDYPCAGPMGLKFLTKIFANKPVLYQWPFFNRLV